MNTNELNLLGRCTIPNFLGVFAINKIPHYSNNDQFSYIVNNQSANLPGQHWIAVYIKNNNAYIYDPLGLPPPLMLTKHLHRYKISYNTQQDQPTASKLCGQFALSFLINKSKFANN